jgi:hypothetical protein
MSEASRLSASLLSPRRSADESRVGLELESMDPGSIRQHAKKHLPTGRFYSNGEGGDVSRGKWNIKRHGRGGSGYKLQGKMGLTL